MSRDPLLRNNVNRSGRPDAATTLLFVNGLGTDQGVWEPVAQAFEARFGVVRFDHVGSVPSNLEDFQQAQVRYLNASGYARDLLEVCDALALQSGVVAVGHSLGGMTALLAAAKRPGLFAGLVLLGTSPHYLDEDGYVGGFSRTDIDAIYEAVTRDYAAWAGAVSQAAVGGEGEPGLVQQFADSLSRLPRDTMLTVLCSVLQADHRAVLAEVKSPVLILQSTKDFFVPKEVAEFLHVQLAGSKLRFIEADGHLPHLTVPATVIEAISGFIETL